MSYLDEPVSRKELIGTLWELAEYATCMLQQLDPYFEDALDYSDDALLIDDFEVLRNMLNSIDNPVTRNQLRQRGLSS